MRSLPIARSFPKIFSSPVLPFCLWAYCYQIRYFSAIQRYCTGSIHGSNPSEAYTNLSSEGDAPIEGLPNPHGSIADWLTGYTALVCWSMHWQRLPSCGTRSVANHILKAPAGSQEVNERDNRAILQSLSDLWICVNDSKRKGCTITNQLHFI